MDGNSDTDLMEHVLGLLTQLIFGLAVADDIIGRLSLNVKRQLFLFAPLHLGPVPTAGRRKPLKPGFFGAIDINQHVALMVQPCFQQQRAVFDHRPAWGRLKETLTRSLPGLVDQRVDQLFQSMQFMRLIEDDLADLFAVNLALRIQNMIAPPRPQGCFDPLGLQRFVSELIGVDDPAAKVGKDPRDRALAGPWRAQQADDRLGVTDCYGFTTHQSIISRASVDGIDRQNHRRGKPAG